MSQNFQQFRKNIKQKTEKLIYNSEEKVTLQMSQNFEQFSKNI